ncbi:MAG: bifunctional phosphopantothenoylcysteine decarboxylase/phosphopantothenate--cysteine ligase CoaBC [SAR202 cluster bacterium]|nr:bifunctional phosphopantothenoylcysteine decarboxylase/phosphopantothenate--cysteine ligase CoaBC [SAR202 cluster bacterium]|tara:strand:+ start:1699 stop:2904 length:1206 start_codon:yes stop_codon:yes gene_type:complete
MKGPLTNKRIVLGVTGSIACYKALELASKLVQNGALVDTIMTKSSQEFLTPLAFKSITHRDVVTNMYDINSEFAINHVGLAESADIIVIAPATANTISKISNGMSDDSLTTTVLASKCPILIAPAMDGNMFDNPATQNNIATLISRGVFISGPEYGRLASGLIGNGRMTSPKNLVDIITMTLGSKGDLSGKKILISAGGTTEPIDPVRFITNKSSGKMGYSIAAAARDRGANVTLVSASNMLENPIGIQIKRVRTSSEMYDVISKEITEMDAIIMAAAVSDWTPKKYSNSKSKKNGSENWSIDLIKTTDIIANISKPNLIKIGFAAESDNLIKNGKSKIQSKSLDLIIANDILDKENGFESDTNKVSIIHPNGDVEVIPTMPKYEVGNEILDRMIRLFNKK